MARVPEGAAYRGARPQVMRHPPPPPLSCARGARRVALAQEARPPAPVVDVLCVKQGQHLVAPHDVALPCPLGCIQVVISVIGYNTPAGGEHL